MNQKYLSVVTGKKAAWPNSGSASPVNGFREYEFFPNDFGFKNTRSSISNTTIPGINQPVLTVICDVVVGDGPWLMFWTFPPDDWNGSAVYFRAPFFQLQADTNAAQDTWTQKVACKWFDSGNAFANFSSYTTINILSNAWNTLFYGTRSAITPEGTRNVNSILAFRVGMDTATTKPNRCRLISINISFPIRLY